MGGYGDNMLIRIHTLNFTQVKVLLTVLLNKP
jgi:hypothetical protein